MSQIDFAIQHYTDLKAEMEEHQQKEPIGLQHNKGDIYYWSKLFYEISDEMKVAEHRLKKLLDDQLDDYMKQTQATEAWNKRVSCLLLNERLGLHFTASVKDLFLFVGRSVMGIPFYYKNKVINDFAHALDDWASLDIDVVRDAVKNIGFKMEETCHSCNEAMPEFEGTGQPICSNCV